MGRTIPTGFEAYARILHPADPGAGVGAGTRWSEVAESTGRVLHALAQFDRICSPAPGGWEAEYSPHGSPRLGDLGTEALTALCDVLGRRTAPGAVCWFALWEGWSDLHVGGGARAAFSSDGRPAARPAEAPPEWQLDPGGPALELPARRYLLFTGPLGDALRFGSWATRDWFLPRSPNLFWPEDRAWCVASEIDFDSTIVGGSRELIEDVLSDANLEAWPIQPADSLAHDADPINTP